MNIFVGNLSFDANEGDVKKLFEVNPARPKAEAQAENELKEKRQPKATVEAEQHPREEREQKKPWLNPVFNKHPALTDRRVRPSGQPGI